MISKILTAKSLNKSTAQVKYYQKKDKERQITPGNLKTLTILEIKKLI